MRKARLGVVNAVGRWVTSRCLACRAASWRRRARAECCSAAIARNQLARLPANNQRRNQNLRYLSSRLEALGINPRFLPRARFGM